MAVLAVIGYHLGAKPRGGFLGVDVFFVLSGYLITRLLLWERAEHGRIRFTWFWARRARRILPAVLILAAVVAVYTAHSGSVGSYAARRADLLSTTFFYANWHFIAVNQSYFAQFTGTSPLEHMWSLGIEEQFYLLWPLAIVACGALLRRKPQVLPAVLLVAALASADLMSALQTPTDSIRAYEGTDTRAFELLIGAALAALVTVHPRLLTTERVRGIARTGLPVVAALVAIGFFAFTDHSVVYFHGGALAFSLVVAAGLLLLEAAPDSLPARLLALPPVRWTGLISYGLYLWHWPVIWWSTSHSATWNPRVKEITDVAVIFAIAAASYYVVERPIRYGRIPWLRASPVRLAGVLGIAVAATVAVSLQSTHVGGALAAQLWDPAGEPCPAGSPRPVANFAWCRYATARPNRPTIALIGDSTSLALGDGVHSVAQGRGWGYVQAGLLGCSVLPLVFSSSAHYATPKDRACVSAARLVLSDVSAKVDPDVWLVSDRGMFVDIRTSGGQALTPGDPRYTAVVTDGLRRVLRRLTGTGSKVVFVLQPPAGPPLECARTPLPRCTAPRYSTREVVTALARRLVRRAAAPLRGKVYVVSIDDVVCPSEGRCPAIVDGKIVRYDGVHFTHAWSLRLAPKIFARAERAGLGF